MSSGWHSASVFLILLIALPATAQTEYSGPAINRTNETRAKARGHASGSEWTALMASIGAAGRRVVARLNKNSTADDRYSAYLQMLGAIQSAYLTLVQSDPDHPMFVPWLGLHEDFTQPNPDTRYLMTSIRGEGVYRIAGTLGNVPKQLLAILGPSDFVNGTVSAPLSTIDLAGLAHDPDGYFELILSAARPAGYAVRSIQKPNSYSSAPIPMTGACSVNQ